MKQNQNYSESEGFRIGILAHRLHLRIAIECSLQMFRLHVSHCCLILRLIDEGHTAHRFFRRLANGDWDGETAVLVSPKISRTMFCTSMCKPDRLRSCIMGYANWSDSLIKNCLRCSRTGVSLNWLTFWYSTYAAMPATFTKLKKRPLASDLFYAERSMCGKAGLTYPHRPSCHYKTYWFQLCHFPALSGNGVEKKEKWQTFFFGHVRQQCEILSESEQIWVYLPCIRRLELRWHETFWFPYCAHTCQTIT